jgi:hypothetical protein
MYVALLWLGSLWPILAPLFITPGQTRMQVEAILRERPAILSSHGPDGLRGTAIYARTGVVVSYNACGQVETVRRLKSIAR